MTAWKPHSIPSLAAPCILLLVFCGQSGALARGSGFSHDEPWNAEHIDRLPPEVRNSVIHMCGVTPRAAHYFATYVDHAKIIKLHFEHFNCEGSQIYSHADRCLHEEFRLIGSHYQLARNYYGRCDD
jgi:hypothetical protein